jgi:hypothetical protein
LSHVITVFYSCSIWYQYFTVDPCIYSIFQLIYMFIVIFSWSICWMYSRSMSLRYFQLFHVFDVFFSCSMYLMYFSAVPCIWWTNSNEELYRSCFTIRRRLLCGSWCYYYTTDDEPSKEEVSFVIPYVVWYNQTCIKRSPLGQRKIVLRRHVTS